MIMEHDLENYDSDLKDANAKIQNKRTENATKSNKCNQCGYASSQAGTLRRHLKTHNGKSQTNATSVTQPAIFEETYEEAQTSVESHYKSIANILKFRIPIDGKKQLHFLMGENNF